jgi:hypothetical protein
MTDPRRLPARLRDPSHVPFGFARYLGDVPDVFQSAGPGGAGAPIKWPLKPSKLYAKYAFKLSGVVVQKGQQVPSNLYDTVFSDDGPVLGNGWYALPSNGAQGAINNFVTVTAPLVSGGIGGGSKQGSKRAVDPDVHNAMRAIQAHHRMQASIPAREKQMRAMAGGGALAAGAGEECGPFTGWCDSGYTCGSNGVCEADAPTGGGYTASGCQSSADCGAGYICDNGTCLPQGGYGCQSDSDCGYGETCDSDGNCISNPTTTSGGCSNDNDCDPGWSCSGGQCVETGATSGCQSDSDCSWGQHCDAGTCVYLSTCSQDSECASNSCVSGYCMPDVGGTGNVIAATPPDTTGPGGGASCFATATDHNDCAGCVDPNGAAGNCMGGNCIQTSYCPGTPPGPPPPGGGGPGGGTPGGGTTTVPGTGGTWQMGDACGASAHVGAGLQCFCDPGYTWAAATGTDCTPMTGTGGGPGTKTGTGPGGGSTKAPPPRGGPAGGGGTGTGGTGTGGTGTNALGDEKMKINPWLLAALGLVVVGGGGAAVYYATRKPSGAKPAGKLPAHKTSKKKR